MSLRHKIVATVGIAALGLGMTSGIAFAQDDTDIADTVVNVTCPYTSTVDVTADAFTIDAANGQTNATIVDGVEVVLDLTCNWSSDFQVGASIGAFQYQGSAPSGSAQSFGGSHFLLTNGSGVYVGPQTLVPLSGAPDVEATVFELLQTNDPTVIVNDTFIIFPVASPGITTATWDSSLLLLPPNLAGGKYIAPLTVTLSVD